MAESGNAVIRTDGGGETGSAGTVGNSELDIVANEPFVHAAAAIES